MTTNKYRRNNRVRKPSHFLKLGESEEEQAIYIISV